MDVFTSILNNNDKVEDPAARIERLRKYLKMAIYTNISKSIFEKDQLVFAMIITMKL